MSTKLNSSKKAKSSASPSLKQGTLGFSSAKRTASSPAVNLKGKKAVAAVVRTASAPAPVEDIDESDSDDHEAFGDNDPIEVSSDEYVGSTRTSIRPKRTLSDENKGSESQTEGKRKTPFKSRDNTEEIDLHAPNPGKWRKHYGVVMAKMGNIPASAYSNSMYMPTNLNSSRLTFILIVHAEGQNKVDHILRVFDKCVFIYTGFLNALNLTYPLSSYEYGPFIGVTRLERWQRASALGLNPPAEVSIPNLFLSTIQPDNFDFS